MHKFYITNNLGGGGTNVSRLYDYIELFDLSNIGILLNYYYLKGHAKPSFDVNLISQLENYDDVASFVSYCKTYFSERRETSPSFKSQISKSYINGYLLDNGCGNFLRNILATNKKSISIQKYIKPFLDFAESLHFDLSVALDLAMKYTYKANEVGNPAFMSKWKQSADDSETNLMLLSEALKIMKKGNYSHKILAPLHGYDYKSFSNYYDEIVKLENKIGICFGGFALGGIANTRVLDNKLWSIPSGFTRNLKSAFLCYNLIKTIRQKTKRYIHVLGAGSIYTLPFLIHAGADSSDCHSAWRRSSDGKGKAKILVPLMDKDFNFINTKNCLEYVRIGDMKSSEYKLNSGYSITKIQNLLQSQNREDYYFGEIIMFYEAILQYQILIDFIENHPNNYLDLLSRTQDQSLNTNYQKIRLALKI